MRIRTAIFAVYVGASALGLAVVMTLVLRDVRLRYVESMRRVMGDTAAYLATYVAPTSSGEDWNRRLETLPSRSDLLRVFACDGDGRVIFDTAGLDLGKTYRWPMTGGGQAASENYTVSNVAEVDAELRVAARVKRGDQFLGWVGVGRPLATVTEGVSAARWRLAGMIGAISLVMVVAGWWIAARLTRSLERLTVYAQQVRAGRAPAPPASRATEIAALTLSFEEMRDTLEGRKHAERYTQTLAHEIKAPLAAIRGAAELMDEEMPLEDRTRFLANIRGESARIQGIVERLLELSSLEARKSLQQTERLDSAALMAEAAAVLRPAFEARRVGLKVVGGAGGSLRGERVLLREALVNLLQNALDFAPAGSAVTLRSDADNGRMVFAVEDTGPGVPDYALTQVFERFYSLPRPDSGRKSTGLGLALVREIAHLHGGDAALNNRPAGGAVATLWVPLEPAR
ncbi:MAG: Sensor protein CreC [Verrucomicrobiota bacterium]